MTVKPEPERAGIFWRTVESVPYAHLVTPQHLSRPAGDYSSLPGEHTTADQIVALNLRYWRKAAGLTQEALGERLGWSGANVSAAERSADPARDRRRFDAETLVMIAAALGVPIPALLMPPPDEGISKRYTIRTAPDYTAGMAVLASMLISDPIAEDTPVAGPYGERYAEVISRYLDPDRAAGLLAGAGELTTAAQRAYVLERLQWQRSAVAALVEDIDLSIETLADSSD